MIERFALDKIRKTSGNILSQNDNVDFNIQQISSFTRKDI